MSVNDVYELIQFIISKNQSGYLTPSDFNRTINQAQTSYASYLLGTLQKYSPGRSYAPVELGQNQVVRQRLTPIIYVYTLSVDPAGFSPYPHDNMQQDAMWSLPYHGRVRYVQQDALYSVLDSGIDPVATNPIYLIEDGGFRFYPNDIGSARLSYVRIPPQIYWAYTLDINGIPAYDPALSVNPVWDDIAMLDIIARALQMVGINLQAPAVNQYANMIKEGGQ